MSLSPETTTLLNVAAVAASEALAENPVAIDVTKTLPFSDAFLILTADNPRHLRGVKNALEDAVGETLGRSPQVEGAEDSDWLLLDYGDVVVHLFLRDAREFYALDQLWNRSPRVELAVEPATRR